MQHSSLRSRLETISMFAKTHNTTDECVVYKLAEDNSFIDMNYVPSIGLIEENLYRTDITLPDEDCILCVVFKDEPIVIIVGDPKKRFIYYRIYEGQDIPFKHFFHDGSIVDSGNLDELGAGFYMHELLVAEPAIIEVDEVPYPVKYPYAPAVGLIKGTIKLQNNVWQLLAMPLEDTTVKESFVDKISAKYGVPGEDLIEICTAYFGDENRFRSYIPSVTNPATANNFPLVYNDFGSIEITGFWVKTKDMTGKVADINDVTLSWSAE